MTTYADKNTLFTLGLPEEDHTLPSGATVRIRSLTRQEMHLVAGHANDTSLLERHTLAAGLVEPKLKPSEAQQLMESVSAAELSGLIEAIIHLSGMDEEEASEKATFPEAGDGSGPGVHDVPGSGAGEDSPGA